MLTKVPALLVFLTLSFIPLSPGNTLAEKPCLELKAVDNPAIAYKKRGERCEGFYQSPVSAGSLTVVGLMFGRLDYSLGQNSPLHIFSPQVRKEIHIQAVGIPMKTYYRLDGWLQPGKSFEWPLDIVNKMRLRAQNIGMYGQLVASPDVYVPLSIKGDTGKTGELIITLRSSVDIGTVQWRKGAMKNNQCTTMTTSQWQSAKPVRGDRFYSGQAIAINIQGQSSNFCMEFAARRAGSGTWLKQLVKIRMED